MKKLLLLFKNDPDRGLERDMFFQKMIFWIFLFPALFSFFMVQVIPFSIGLYY